HFADVAVRFGEPLGRAIDERGRRRVGHKPAHELRRDECRGGGRSGEEVEHLLAVILAAAGPDVVPEDDLLSFVVEPRLEPERAAVAWLIDRPAGERARDIDDVGLRVAAVHAERVQLHQLAAVVLVEAALLLLLRLRILLGGKARAEEAAAAAPDRYGIVG